MNSPRTASVLTGVLAAVCMLQAPAHAQSAQDHSTRAQLAPDFDPLASEMAAAIEESTKGSTGSVQVLVVDFENRTAPATELDHVLAAEFADSLRKHSRHFLVMNRDDLLHAITQQHLPETILSDAGAMKCLAPEFGATGTVEGKVEYAPDGAVLQLSALLAKPYKSFFGKETVVPIPDQMRELLSKPLPAPQPFFTTEEKVWVNPDHPPLGDDAVFVQEAGDQRFKGPKCTSCPRPEFSDDAMRTRFQGTILLRVQILADGFPARISVIKGLPCGLTEKAFEAVEHWIFKPAMRADGTPVAVVVPVEVTFRLY
jgi:TonB family protein